MYFTFIGTELNIEHMYKTVIHCYSRFTCSLVNMPARWCNTVGKFKFVSVMGYTTQIFTFYTIVFKKFLTRYTDILIQTLHL